MGGHDKLCKLFWGVNIFSAPGMGRVSPKLVGQNKNAPALPPGLIFDRSLRIVCLDTDVLQTALVAIHHARLNPIPDPIGNK